MADISIGELRATLTLSFAYLRFRFAKGWNVTDESTDSNHNQQVILSTTGWRICSRTWVGLTFLLAIPSSAWFCLG